MAVNNSQLTLLSAEENNNPLNLKGANERLKKISFHTLSSSIEAAEREQLQSSLKENLAYLAKKKRFIKKFQKDREECKKTKNLRKFVLLRTLKVDNFSKSL